MGKLNLKQGVQCGVNAINSECNATDIIVIGLNRNNHDFEIGVNHGDINRHIEVLEKALHAIKNERLRRGLIMPSDNKIGG